jgi:hypothetical protein
MKKIILALMLLGSSQGFACEQCTALFAYVEVESYYDSCDLYYAEFDSNYYWFLKGRLSAWRDIRAMKD